MRNLFNGGTVAPDIADRSPGRLECVYLKDVIRTAREDQFESTSAGVGVADVRELLSMIGERGGARVSHRS